MRWIIQWILVFVYWMVDLHWNQMDDGLFLTCTVNSVWFKSAWQAAHSHCDLVVNVLFLLWTYKNKTIWWNDNQTSSTWCQRWISPERWHFWHHSVTELTCHHSVLGGHSWHSRRRRSTGWCTCGRRPPVRSWLAWAGPSIASPMTMMIRLKKKSKNWNGQTEWSDGLGVGPSYLYGHL